MNSALYALASLSLLVAGCAGSAALEPAAPRADTTPAVAADDAATTTAIAAAPTTEAARAPGDFVVFKLTGATRAAPMTLTERVIAREGDTLVVDVLADDGASKQQLRVRFGDSDKNRNEVLSVAKLEGGKEIATTTDAYESLLAGLSADANEAVLGAEDVKVAVGAETIDAKRTSFRVRVGKKHATLRTLESPTFAWGDLGGEITTDAGKVLYKAEVVDAGHATAKAPAMAIDE